jgi:hypothetical protein
MTRPRPDVRRWQRRGAELREEAQGPLFHPGVTGKGKAGRVNVSEPSMMSRYVGLLRWDADRSAGLAAEKRQVPAGDSVLAGRAPPPRDREGTLPGRVLRARNVETPSGSRLRPGRLTVRKAQFPGGTG